VLLVSRGTASSEVQRDQLGGQISLDKISKWSVLTSLGVLPSILGSVSRGADAQQNLFLNADSKLIQNSSNFSMDIYKSFFYT